MSKGSKIFATGHRGMVGNGLVRTLQAQCYTSILTCGRSELDLLTRRAVTKSLAQQRPNYIFRATAIYPRDCAPPSKEEHLLNGLPEKTNESYAIAEIAGIKLAEIYNPQYGREYVSVMLTNLYGSNDNDGLANSHVLPALLREARKAKQRGDPGLCSMWALGKT